MRAFAFSGILPYAFFGVASIISFATLRDGPFFTVPAMRRALELWGNPLREAPVTGENLATALGEADMDHVEQLAAIIRRVDGNNSLGAAALAEAILGRYPCAFLVDPLDTPPAPERAVPHCRRAGPVNSALPTTITFDPQC